MTRQPGIARHAEALLGSAVVATSSVAGGDLSTATRLRLSNGTTALMAAAHGGYLPLVELLIQHGTSVDLRNRDGETALLKAAEEGLSEIVRILAAASADVQAADHRGRTALAVAAERAYTDLIETLSTLGAGLDPENARRLVENAERNGWTDVAALLRRIPERS